MIKSWLDLWLPRVKNSLIITFILINIFTLPSALSAIKVSIDVPSLQRYDSIINRLESKLYLIDKAESYLLKLEELIERCDRINCIDRAEEFLINRTGSE